jgi:ribonuclease-3
MKRKKALGQLEERIGHRFKDKALLELALTHTSAPRPRVKGGGHYQRLEFLGDHVLGLAISELLYRNFPSGSEGDLSRRLSALVRGEACAEVALALDLGPHLRLSGGEAQSGGRKKQAILGDVCESVIGAVFLDAGYEAALGVVERLWQDRLKMPAHLLRDAKTALQEWAQRRGMPPPVYHEKHRRGPDHRPEFLVSVELPGLKAAEGSGRSKRSAEMAAAVAMLKREGVALAGADV